MPAALKAGSVATFVLTLSICAVGCTAATSPQPTTSAAPQTVAGTTRIESPADSVSGLARPGLHCFASPTDAVLAAARIDNYYLRRRLDYEANHRRFDVGGPLMPYGSNEMGEVSDHPDDNHCVEVTTYLYEDRFLPPAPSTTSAPRPGR